MSRKPLRIIIAGGGTGGHLFPGIAIADEFKAENSKTKVYFIGTDRKFEVNILAKAGYPHYTITARGIKGLGIINGLRTLAVMPKSLWEAARYIRKLKPEIVIGVGGYSSGPVVMTARLLGIKTAIHEQNSIPGITNKILSIFTHRIYISFSNTKKTPRILTNDKKTVFTGNPVRKEIINAGVQESETRKNLFTVLIIGGSQGAHAINMAVIKTLDYIENIDKIHFFHQTGEKDMEIVKKAYKKQKVSCSIQPFFENMAELYKKADLLICRAGATTIAEITAIGKSAVFIPFPYAADDHQRFNAQNLADNSAADMIIEKELYPESLAGKINYYRSNPEALKNMASNAKKHGRPDAAQRIVKDCCKLITDNWKKCI